MTAEIVPSLSVVVAVQHGAQRLPAVLASLRAQRAAEHEILVCYARGASDIAEICRHEDWIRVHESAERALIPHLWRDGILAARGTRVALSTVHCVPPLDWLARLAGADLERFAAVGGAIANGDSDGRGLAIFLLRYLRYAPPFEPRLTADLPGDHVVYARDTILAHRDAFADGFWEPAIHARLEREGRPLLLDPALVTLHRNGYSTSAFARQRLAHGMRYGYDRGSALRPALRSLYALATPAALPVLAARIARQARKHGCARDLARAAPHLALFLLAWTLGEAAGALRALLPHRV